MNLVNWDLILELIIFQKILYKNWESMGYVSEEWQSVCMPFARVRSLSHGFKNDLKNHPYEI